MTEKPKTSTTGLQPASQPNTKPREGHTYPPTRVYQYLPKSAKKMGSRIPEPQIQRILQRHVSGESVREISRAEGRARETVGRIVKCEEMQTFVGQMRERLFGLGDCAIEALQNALQEQKDGRLAFQLLLSIGVIPSERQREMLATQLATAEQAPHDVAVRALALRMMESAIRKWQAFNVPLPEPEPETDYLDVEPVAANVKK